MRFTDKLYTKRIAASFLNLLGVAMLPNFLIFYKKLPDHRRKGNGDFCYALKAHIVMRKRIFCEKRAS